MNIDILKKNPQTGEVFERICFVDGSDVVHELAEDKPKNIHPKFKSQLDNAQAELIRYLQEFLLEKRNKHLEEAEGCNEVLHDTGYFDVVDKK